MGQIIGVAIDSSGDIYASSEGSGDIEKYSPLGADLGSYGNVYTAYGIAFDTSGNLLVASASVGTGSLVYAIPPNGGTPFVYASGLDGPTYIT